MTPEYNNSIPGVFKNAIDWMTRPPEDIGHVFKGKPVGLIGASPGMFGTISSQTAWLPIFRTLNMRPFFGKNVYVSGASKLFNEQYELIDEKTTTRLQSYLEAYSNFISLQST